MLKPSLNFDFNEGFNQLGDKQGGELGQAALVELLVELAFVAAMGGVGGETVMRTKMDALPSLLSLLPRR